MMFHGKDIPNPGSDEAIKQGCYCAVYDNNHGKWPPFRDPDGWWISQGCPVHADESIAT
jgi:hypothetical protein